jgi:hypothetical protein
MRPLQASVLLLALFFYPLAIRGQTTNASISGRVTDPSKATVLDAGMAAVNIATNFRYESATNGAGEYTLANTRWRICHRERTSSKWKSPDSRSSSGQT